MLARISLRSTTWQIAAYVATMLALGALVVRGAAALPYHWQWERIPPYLVKSFRGTLYPGALLRGLGVTVEISLEAMAVALLAGLVTALLRRSRSLVARALARVYVELVRNTPLLVQLYLFYFVVAPVLALTREATAVLALGLFEGAFAAEIIRAGILAVPRGQEEAALSLGLRQWPAHRFVVLPQALRIVLPPLSSLAVSTIKHSAIISVIAVFDLANEGRSIIADTFLTFEVWLTVAGLYLLLTISLSACASLLERRLGRPVTV
ncbi:MAG: amino acid ABC transporter permease [Janthinobacterium lividum]